MAVDQAGVATRALALFAAGQPARDVPEAVRAVFHLSLQDWCAVARAGASEPVSRQLRALVVEEGGAPQADVIGGPRVPARAAALANGAISHALDYDDTHFDHIGHPSVAVIPAALAMAQRLGVSGRAFQDAAIIGMEASIAIGVWLGRNHYQSGFHQTATAGAFGAAVAAGRVMNFDRAQMERTIGLVATRASGIKAQFGTMGKPFNAGIAASNGVEAALLAASGFKPNPGALDGPQGFGATHAGEARDAELASLGTIWRLPRVQHKFHACCHGLHAALEAFAKLPGREPDKIARIEVRVHPRWLTVCNTPAPATGLELKFSYAGVLAMAALGISTARLENYSLDVAQDPHVIGIGRRVHVHADESLTETQARVALHDAAGAGDEAFADLMTPMTLAQRTRRVQDKCADLVGRDLAITLRRKIISSASPTELTEAFMNPGEDIRQDGAV